MPSCSLSVKGPFLNVIFPALTSVALGWIIACVSFTHWGMFGATSLVGPKLSDRVYFACSSIIEHSGPFLFLTLLSAIPFAVLSSYRKFTPLPHIACVSLLTFASAEALHDAILLGPIQLNDGLGSVSLILSSAALALAAGAMRFTSK